LSGKVSSASKSLSLKVKQHKLGLGFREFRVYKWKTTAKLMFRN